jgi:hypothetical protein
MGLLGSQAADTGVEIAPAQTTATRLAMSALDTCRLERRP